MDVDAIRRPLEPAIRRVFHTYWRFSRGLTLGVRGLVLDELGRVFLIKHSYVAGWHLPGGGVEIGETLATALARELREEGNIELIGAPELLRGFIGIGASPGAITSRSTSCARFARARRRSPTAKSWRTDSLRLTGFRTARPSRPARAFPKCSTAAALRKSGSATLRPMCWTSSKVDARRRRHE